MTPLPRQETMGRESATHPVMFKPQIWRGVYSVTKEDTMNMIEQHLTQNLRGWDPKKLPDSAGNAASLDACRRIILGTMSVDTRYLTRPVCAVKARCTKKTDLTSVNGETLMFEALQHKSMDDEIQKLVNAAAIYGGIWLKLLGEEVFVACDVRFVNHTLVLKAVSVQNNVYIKSTGRLTGSKQQHLVPFGAINVGSIVDISGVPPLTSNISTETQMHIHLCTSIFALVGTNGILDDGSGIPYDNELLRGEQSCKSPVNIASGIPHDNDLLCGGRPPSLFPLSDSRNTSQHSLKTRGVIHYALDDALLSAWNIDYLVVTQ